MIDRHIHDYVYVDSLNEIKYLSFASLNKLLTSLTKGEPYKIYNFNTRTREKINFERVFIKILQSSLISDISNYLI
jgi:hypothetical protein